MVRFGDDQRRIAETMRRLEMGMAHQTSEQQNDVPQPTRPTAQCHVDNTGNVDNWQHAPTNTHTRADRVILTTERAATRPTNRRPREINTPTDQYVSTIRQTYSMPPPPHTTMQHNNRR